MDSSLADLPHEHDAYVQLTLSQLKGGKAAGSSGILPEMLKIGQINGHFMLMLTELVSVLKEEGMCCKIGGMPFLFHFLRRVTFVVVIIGKELLCMILLGNWLQELCKTAYSSL